MISQNKAIALTIFIHSRLSGKYTDTNENNVSIVNDTEDKELLEDQLGELYNNLTTDCYTFDSLIVMKKSVTLEIRRFYYQIAINTYTKNLSEGDEKIDQLIALSILSYLSIEKNIGTLDGDILELIAIYEKQKDEKDLISKMMRIGTEIVEAVEKSDFMKRNKKKRVSKKKKKII